MRFSRSSTWASRRLGLTSVLVLVAAAALAGPPPPVSFYLRPVPDLSEIFEPKMEVMVAMRDGVRLYTEVYVPKGKDGPLPIILERTPYNVNAGDLEYSERLALYSEFFEEGFIFALQDIRGRYRSEGEHVTLRPQADPNDPNGIDESTDFYDTIDWLVKSVPGNNGNVGTLGISYGGFLSLRAMINPHPALKAVSPGASCADMFVMDDFHHNGAFRLSYSLSAAMAFDLGQGLLSLGQRDEYQLLLDMGPLANVDQQIFKGESYVWNAFKDHPNLDDMWRYGMCGVMPHLDEVTVPALHVIGWWDMEDFAGPIEAYRKLERKDHDNRNYMIIGPWRHGGWTFDDTGRELKGVDLGSDTARYFRERYHVPWFTYWLKGKGELDLPEVTAFQMGSNIWETFDEWPPNDGIEERKIYLREDGRLSFEAPTTESSDAYDSYVSDPANPVPYRARPFMYPWGWPAWMLEDQRFASNRPDVISWISEPLGEDLTITGSPIASLFATTTGADADWVVKLMDVHPEDFSSWETSGYQMIVRAEVFRGRFRNSFERPEPIPANEVVPYEIDLRSCNHRFRAGHRIMVQIQSSWFPIIDRNPQTWVPNIFEAQERDFQKATQRIYRSNRHPTHIKLPVRLR